MMEGSTPKIPNGLTEDEKESSKKISLKDRKHRRDKNDGVDALKTFFQILTAVELPKRNSWDEVAKLVWRKIFEARELEKQRKASMKLEQYAETARQIVKSARDAKEEAQIDLNWLESWMEPLQQQLLDEDYAQLGSEVDISVMGGQGSEEGEMKASLQSQDFDPNFVKSEEDVVARELENKLEMLRHEINAEVQQLYGHPVNLKFSMPQQPVHRIRKNQGHTALKVFFYMHTNIVLPNTWKKAEELVKEKIKDAEEGKKLNDISGPPEGAATLKQIVNSTLAASQEAKREVENCKCRFQSVGPQIQDLFYSNCHKQYGASSEAVNPYVDNEALLAYMPESNDMVLGNLQNPPVSADSAQMLAPLEYREVEPHRDDECWLEDISKIFPEIKENGVFEVLLEMAKSVPHTVELKDTNQESELDLRFSQAQQEVDKTYEELKALPQNKRKLNRPKKLQVKKGKRPE